MPTFFSASDGTNPVGRTIAIADPHTQGTSNFISISPTISWAQHKSIITRVTVSHQGNFQFLHTIGNDVYIYVFGDRIGQIMISGISVAAACNTVGNEHGFEDIMQWYSDNRIANRNTPVTLSIGQSTIQGFVVALSGDAVDPMSRMVQYGLQLAVIPPKR